MFALIVATIVALIIGGAVIFTLYENENPHPVKFGVLTFAVAETALFAFLSLAIVSASHVGVLTEFGSVQSSVLSEGLHFVKPWTRVYSIFVGLETASLKDSEAGSKDLQSVHTSFTINYRVDPARARDLYILNPALEYENYYVVPAMYESFKAVSARYTAEQLITKREEVSAAIREVLGAKLKQYGMTVQALNITNFGFSKSFNEAIEAKVTASQQAEKAERDLVRFKFEAEQKIATAKGQAEAIRIQAEAVKAQGGKEYVQLEAIKKWNGALPNYLGGQTPMPFIDVAK